MSVKQTAARTTDPALASPECSSASATWLHSHRNPVTCDGQVHTATSTVDALDYGQGGSVQTDDAHVQFCLFDDNNIMQPLSENEFMQARAA